MVHVLQRDTFRKMDILHSKIDFAELSNLMQCIEKLHLSSIVFYLLQSNWSVIMQPYTFDICIPT